MAAIKVLYGQQYVVNRLYGHIGSSEHCMEVSRPSWAQPGPTLSTQCGMPKARAFLLVFITILCVDAFGLGHVFPRSGLSWAQVRRQMPPHTHVKPNLRAPKLCHIGPQLGSSWDQLGAIWPEFGGSCSARLRPSTAKFHPTSPLLSSLGGVLAAKRLKQTIQFLGIPHDYGNPQLSWGLVISSFYWMEIGIRLVIDNHPFHGNPHTWQWKIYHFLMFFPWKSPFPLAKFGCRMVTSLVLLWSVPHHPHHVTVTTASGTGAQGRASELPPARLRLFFHRQFGGSNGMLHG